MMILNHVYSRFIRFSKNYILAGSRYSLVLIVQMVLGTLLC